MNAPVIRRGFADTPEGQLHWRATGDGPADIVLLHWAPGSSRMFEPILREFALRGVRVRAFDLPGFGQSFKPPVPWGPVEMARNLLAGIATQQSTPFTLLGGHLAAEVVVEAALLEPKRIPAVVLDGIYALTPEENKALLAPYAGLTPRFREDGSHERFLWVATRAILQEWNPRFVPGPNRMVEMFDAMNDYLQMGYEAIRAWLEPSGPPPAYDVLARIAKVRARMLVLGAEFEALRPAIARALAANPAARAHDFPGSHPLFVPAHAGEYADVVARFARGG